MTARGLAWRAAALAASTAPIAAAAQADRSATAELSAAGAPADPVPAPTPTPATVPTAPTWIATLSSGVLDHDGDAARPFAVAGVSRKLGRYYVRVAATGFRSVVRQFDAALPSSFALGSIGAGATFGRWFVDASASAGRQFYGGIEMGGGTRSNQAGSGSGVYAAALDAGRFVALARRLYVTPSLAVQYAADRAPRIGFGPDGPIDYDTAEHAWTGSATVRLDRFFGGRDQHVAGVSISRVQTTDGAAALAASPGGGPVAAGQSGLRDGWFVAGASASFRLSPRLWLDAAGTRTTGARSGDYAVLSLGVRRGF